MVMDNSRSATVDRLVKELRSFCISAGNNPMTVTQLIKDYRSLLGQDVNEVLTKIGCPSMLKFLQSRFVQESLAVSLQNGIWFVKAVSRPDTLHIERLVAKQKKTPLTQFTRPAMAPKSRPIRSMPQRPPFRRSPQRMTPRRKPAEMEHLVNEPLSNPKYSPVRLNPRKKPTRLEYLVNEPLSYATDPTPRGPTSLIPTPSPTTLKRTRELLEEQHGSIKASDFRRLYEQKFGTSELDGLSVADLLATTFTLQPDEVELSLELKKTSRGSPVSQQTRVVYNSNVMSPGPWRQMSPYRRIPKRDRFLPPISPQLSCWMIPPPPPPHWSLFPLHFPPFPMFPSFPWNSLSLSNSPLPFQRTFI